MKIKLDVGYRGFLDDLKQILEYETVKSVYTGGVNNIIAGGRPQYISSLSGLEKQADYCHSKHVELNIALNAPCNIRDKSDTEWWQRITAYIKDIESAGVDGVIISHPFLMELVKEHTKLKLIVSTICEVENGNAAQYYENLGADVLIPSMNVNWDFKALKDIKKASKEMKLRLMVNEYCLIGCPWRKFHHNHTAHNGEHIEYLSKCTRIYIDNPALFLMNSAIRPEDTDLFANFTDDFKIVSRLFDPSYTEMIVKAYSSKEYADSFLDLFGSEFKNKIWIDNKKLDMLASFKKKCAKNCHECSKCAEIYNQAVS